MAKLLPCPFCGGNLKEMKSDFTFNLPKNLCQLDYMCECGMRFTKTVHTTPEDEDVAFRVWNTRIPKERGTEQ